jgi:hypothetical protein
MKMTDEENRLQRKPYDTCHRAITTLCVATAAGACLALVSFFLLDFLFIFAFFLAILIVRTAYRADLPPRLKKRFIVTPWTHLIALGSSLVGALCAAVMREGLCYVITNAEAARLEPLQHVECGIEMTKATLFGASFFLLLPTALFAWWFWYLGRLQKG